MDEEEAAHPTERGDRLQTSGKTTEGWPLPSREIEPALGHGVSRWSQTSALPAVHSSQEKFQSP